MAYSQKIDRPGDISISVSIMPMREQEYVDNESRDILLAERRNISIEIRVDGKIPARTCSRPGSSLDLVALLCTLERNLSIGIADMVNEAIDDLMKAYD